MGAPGHNSARAISGSDEIQLRLPSDPGRKASVWVDVEEDVAFEARLVVSQPAKNGSRGRLSRLEWLRNTRYMR